MDHSLPKRPLLSSFQLRIFFGTFLAVFLMVALQLLGVKPPKLVIPVPSMHPQVMEILTPHLERKEHIYNLHRKQSFVPTAHASDVYDDAKAYAVVDYKTGEVLFEKNAELAVSIASITKVMTSVVALDLAGPEELFIVTENAAATIPTKIGVRVGEQLTLRELLHASLMTSANDATAVIKDGINAKYGQDVFVKAMNKKAEILGLSKTHFENPQGFDGNTHHSSAGDVAILTHYAMTHYPLIAEIAMKDYILLPKSANHKQYDLINWNGLLGVYPNITGLKIGNTDDAGTTTVVLSEREGVTLATVLLGAPGIAERDLWTAKLLDIGFGMKGIAPADITREDLQEKYDSWQY